MELITPAKPKFNWGTTKTIELDIKNQQCNVNGFKAAITNLKLYNITRLLSYIISCNLVISGHLSFAKRGLSNYVTLNTAYAWTNSGITEAESYAIVSGELQYTKLNVFMDTLVMYLKAKYPNLYQDHDFGIPRWSS